MGGKMKLGRGAWLRIAAYGVAVLLPFIVGAFGAEHEEEGERLLRSVGKAIALMGFAMLSMQFLVAARIKWAVEPFGLDRVMRFHKWAGITAGTLIVLHPLGLVGGGAPWGMIFGKTSSDDIIIGRLAMLLLVALVVVSVYRLALKLEFQKWRLGHDIVAPVILVMGFVHSWELGDELEAPAARVLWAMYLVTALAALLYTRIIAPIYRNKHAYSIAEVKRETHDAWTLKLVPGEGTKRFDYLPGQFHFVTLHRGRGLKAEEHPFTISSSPSEGGFVTSTIKQSGDYTATVGETLPGDAVAIQGPFGRFSYVLFPEENDLVFIAGGIGITPLMSMLRHMRDTASEKKVHLIWGNKTEGDIAFREELAAMESGGRPSLKVTHVLSAAEESWQGERGYVDGEKITRLCGDVTGKAFYICGPLVMMKKVIAALDGLGVDASRIHHELFSL